MKIRQLTVRNLLSFRDETSIFFDPSFTILVGPNGGGKSNLLDILTIVLRHYLIKGVYVQEFTDVDGQRFADLYQMEPLTLSSLLPRFGDTGPPWEVICEFELTESDLKFIETVIQSRAGLSLACGRLRHSVHSELAFVDTWAPLCAISPGESFKYQVTSNGVLPVGKKEEVETAHLFLDYLNKREFFCRLAGGTTDILLPDTYLYFSPYRGGVEQNLKASLSEMRKNDLLRQYNRVTSKNTTALLQMGSVHFAQKRRKLENSAEVSGFKRPWNEDREVQMVTSYVERLGYSWDLELVDPDKNVYEVLLTKDGYSFRVENASSGEREILGFLLGIFAFNMRNGMIIIDEPELHLHPRWQAILRELLVDLATQTGNQIIVATHSPSFITSENLGNVVRIFKDKEGVSRTTSASRTPEALSPSLDRKALAHMIISHNNEKTFFADQVVLVEGISDRLLFSAILANLCEYLGRTDSVEVLEVHGKANFGNYTRFLASIDQRHSTIADLDHILDIQPTGFDLRDLFCTNHKKMASSLADKKSLDGKVLVEVIEDAIRRRELCRLDFSKFEGLYVHILSRHQALKKNLSLEEEQGLQRVLESAKTTGVFVLRRGELETYLPARHRGVEGILALIQSQELFQNWLSQCACDPKVKELVDICLDILDATDTERAKLPWC